MRILITGAAGFIGFHTAKQLLQNGHTVIGLDNINSYYNPKLKYDRLGVLGIEEKAAKVFNKKTQSKSQPNFCFIRLNIEDNKALTFFYKEEGEIDVVCHLAAQAGVRYSLENPQAYIDSNIQGFFNILELCRNFKVPHLVFASSSSVYGLNKNIPFKTSDNVDSPISLYAASKKSNELMAHTYSHLFGFKTTGLRFFTVYGPWGRPDMAAFLFTKNIIEDIPIKVFNNGEMERDFTYIDDIVKGIVKVIEPNKTRLENYKIYNIGNNNTVKLMDFISTIETRLNKKAIKQFLPIQPGDVRKTWADVTELIKDYNYSPETSIEHGVSEFIDWYKGYYKV